MLRGTSVPGRHLTRRTVLKGTAVAGLGAGLWPPAGRAGGRANRLQRGARPPNVIALEARSEPVRYRFEVTGRVEKGPEAGGTDEIVGDDAVRGLIDTKGALDNFRFSGRITAFSIDEGSATVFVNGEAVDDPVGLPGADLPNAIVLRAQSEPVRYRFAVSERVEKGPEAGGTDEIVGDDAVEGLIDTRGAVDSFHFAGRITAFSIDEGSATVFVNGEAVDDPVGSPRPDLPHTIELQSRGEEATYRFGVSGTVEKGPRADHGDRIVDGNAVRGSVGREGSDDFYFSGRITDLSGEDGPLTVRVELRPD